MNTTYDLEHIHSTLATSNYASIKLSSQCGCFYCLKVFSSTDVTEWITEGDSKTAVCPHCGIDSVIPATNSDNTVDTVLLSEMREHWFDSKVC
jgi:hypothetical protein